MAGYFSTPFPRRRSVGVNVGGVVVGGPSPCCRPVHDQHRHGGRGCDRSPRFAALHSRAGSEIVRITVDRDEAAAAVPRIRERLDRLGHDVPLIGDFHYIGHKLLVRFIRPVRRRWPNTASTPAMSAFREKRDRQFAEIVEMAIRYDKPVRIGVNWGSLDQELLTRPSWTRTRRTGSR